MIDRAESTRILVDVTNRGDRAGQEVVHLYIRDVASSVTRPVKELTGFQRVALQPQETRTASFDVGPDQLASWNMGMKLTVEPGEFELMVGPNSVELQTVRLRVR